MEETPKTTDQPVATKSVHEAPKHWLLLALVMLCFGAGFGGGWVGSSVNNSESPVSSSTAQTVISSESELINELVQEVGPSVVSITATSRFRQGSIYYGSRLYESQSAGTGVIVSSDGYIMTNRHVIPEGVSKLAIVTSDGTEYTNVRVVGRDPFNDLAYLKIDGVTSLKAAKIGDSSQTQVGDRVIAIGNALGQFENTVTSGIISGLGRPVLAGEGEDLEQLTNLLQTDAAINPGNSGGPLINVNGEVIGINTAVAGEGENIGFAIPVNDAVSGIKSVTTQGKLVKAYLGVRYIMLSPVIAREAGVGVNEGALVVAGAGEPAVASGSPAAKAGLKLNDVITKINDTELNENQPLGSVIGRFNPDDTVMLTVVRGDRTLEIEAVLGEVPPSLMR